MRRRVIFVAFYCCSTVALLYSFVFNNSIEKKAELDILVSVTQPTPVTIVSPINTDASGSIARYSFYFKADEQVMYWEKLYSHFLTSFIHPEMHFFMPTEKGNQFSITLTPAKIQDLTGKELGEIFVIIRQRTYAYNASTGRLDFYSYVPLKEIFVPLDVTISITASGVINPAKFDELSPSLKIIYPKAQGGAVVQ